MRDRVVGTTVRIDFQTNDADGAPVAPSSAFVASDFRIYKDGSATQKATTNGITVTSPFDSVVGDHLIEIDTSNNTGDDGFWALGSEYRVKINSAKTVDGQVQSGVKVDEFRLVTGKAELDSASRVKLATDQPDYAPATAAALAAVDAKIGTPETSLSAMVGNVPTVTEFEARTIAAASYRQNITLRGADMTEAKAFDLLLAASAGITSQPSGTTEKFKFLDGNDAFTTTFDTNGNRTGVSLA